jgi:hypothetical protein
MPVLGTVPPVIVQGKVVQSPLTGPSSDIGAPVPEVVLHTHAAVEVCAAEVEGTVYTRT